MDFGIEEHFVEASVDRMGDYCCKSGAFTGCCLTLTTKGKRLPSCKQVLNNSGSGTEHDDAVQNIRKKPMKWISKDD